MSKASTSIRVAIYTHDAYGIGHVRRCLNIIQALALREPKSAILFITGSPAVDLFKYLPSNADYLKIPTIVTSDMSGDRPPMLQLGLSELTLIRQQLIQQAVLTFEPDVFLVDNFPLGSRRELLPILKELRNRPTRAILGLRDIADPPEKIKKDWSRDGIYEVLQRHYHRILVYGMREVLDIADAYELSGGVAEKVHYCGYLTSDNSHAPTVKDVRKELGLKEPFILATVGGGGDGFPLLKVFLETLPLISKPSVVITGPRMNISERAALRSLGAKSSGVQIIEFVPDLPRYMAAADVVVSMAGYNTLTEIMANDCKAIVFPRTWYSGEHAKSGRGRIDLEQLTRAKALARLGLVDLLEPKDLKPELLAKRISSMLNGPRDNPKILANLHGLRNTVDHILEMANGGM